MTENPSTSGKRADTVLSKEIKRTLDAAGVPACVSIQRPGCLFVNCADAMSARDALGMNHYQQYVAGVEVIIGGYSWPTSKEEAKSLPVKPKTSTSRVAKLRREAKEAGLKRREYYASPAEHAALQSALDAMRKGENHGTN